jgi:hypothetical protein
MGVYKLHTVAINSTMTTMVGSVNGVLGGVRHENEDKWR